MRLHGLRTKKNPSTQLRSAYGACLNEIRLSLRMMIIKRTYHQLWKHISYYYTELLCEKKTELLSNTARMIFHDTCYKF